MKRKIGVFVLALVILALVFLNLYWLSIGLLFIYIILIIANRVFLLYLSNIYLRKVLSVILAFVGFIILGISIKVFLFELYDIPSSSMEDTLYDGDVILVDKLYLGPKLPRTPYEIPWLNLLFYQFRDSSFQAHKSSWGFIRLSGITFLKQGDVIVFNYISDSRFLVKRCVATSGDEIQIIDGKILVNDTIYSEPTNVKKRHTLLFKNKAKYQEQIENVIGDSNQNKKGDISTLNLLKFEGLKDIINTPMTDTIIKDQTKYSANERCFFNAKYLDWSKDNTGSMKVPYKGMSIELNKFNYSIYKKTIENFEKERIVVREGKYFIRDEEVYTYDFQNDYFFAMGDNRENSIDSRNLGFLPYNSLIGKARYVIYSKKNQPNPFERILINIK